MSREAASIPIALWISAAILAHMAGGGGAVQAARALHDRADLRGMVKAVRAELRPADTTFEVLADTVEPTPQADAAEAPDKASPTDKSEPNDAVDPDPKRKKPAPPPEVKPKPAPKPVAKPPPPPPPPPPEKPKIEPPVAAAPPPPPPPPLPPQDNRIVIRQHAAKDQPDNPEAKRLADEANHVKPEDEMVARVRSHDQDDPDPSVGGRITAGSRHDEGNSDHNKTADSEDHKGDAKHAPGEKDEASTTATHSNPAPPSAPSPPEAVAKSAPQSAPGARAAGGGGRIAAPAQPAAPPPSPGGAGPASPEVVSSEGKGGYTLNPTNPGGDGSSRRAGRRQAAAPYESPVKVGRVGLGAPGALGGPNINLTMPMVVAAVGSDKLKAERAADGAARRSAHAGTSRNSSFDRLRAAIENYEPSVKEGNMTALAAAAAPFATYINTIHNRLHPIFAEEFLGSLENLPPENKLNQDLVTHLEIVLSKDEGRIVRLGVTRASGVTAFDAVALNSVERASPYGKAPDAIVSPDGNVYLHWEFHRDPFDACTTRNARPILLKEAPTVGVKRPPPRRPSVTNPSEERGGPLLPLAPR